MAEFKEWVVELVVTSEHRYVVPGRTPEEAVATAEDLFADGDEGEIIATSIDTADAATGTFDDTDVFEEEDLAE